MSGRREQEGRTVGRKGEGRGRKGSKAGKGGECRKEGKQERRKGGRKEGRKDGRERGGGRERERRKVPGEFHRVLLLTGPPRRGLATRFRAVRLTFIAKGWRCGARGERGGEREGERGSGGGGERERVREGERGKRGGSLDWGEKAWTWTRGGVKLGLGLGGKL